MIYHITMDAKNRAVSDQIALLRLAFGTRGVLTAIYESAFATGEEVAGKGC